MPRHLPSACGALPRASSPFAGFGFRV
jgi:hypothetical protein